MYSHAEFQNFKLFEVSYEMSVCISLVSKQNNILSFLFTSLSSAVFPNVITNTPDFVKFPNQMYGII
jgi:hypothetical protein